MRQHDLVFGIGPAGTGKTYLAVATGVALLRQRVVDRLILSRPAVEAGERLGFLPGDMKDKVDPYLRPLYDALQDMLPDGKLGAKLESGQIEIAPLAFMRGRTLANAFVILDEAQNTTPAQMKMFLTRLGENSRMVVTGDPSQDDLPPGTRSGLIDAVDRLDRDQRGRGDPLLRAGHRAAPAGRGDSPGLQHGKAHRKRRRTSIMAEQKRPSGAAPRRGGEARRPRAAGARNPWILTHQVPSR